MSDEKKISLEELEDLLEENEGSSSSKWNFATIYAMLVLNWQYFLFSLIILLCGAFLYLRYTEPVYKVSARMLIKDEDKNKANAAQMLAGIEDLGFLSNSTGINNEVEVLQSRLLLRDVVKDLKLYIEYRGVGRVINPIVYGTQPFNVDLDPVHLDTLDYALLSQSRSLRLQVCLQADSTWRIDGTVIRNGKEGETFAYRARRLPTNFQTPLGTVTMTAAVNYQMKSGATYIATIRPPMQVATEYLSRLTIAPTSKQTSIAELTLKDKNIRRGIDVLRQLTVCYNRQANADKNEIARRTEEFINDRMTHLNQELGMTEGKIESFKRQNAVTSVSIDASQSVQMASQFSARLSEADAQIQILDNLRSYVNNPTNKYQVIPSNIGMTDGASVALINSYNQAVQDRNRLLKAASEQAPQVQTLTATIEELQSSIKDALSQARRSADINRQGIQSQYGKFQGQVATAPTAERVLTQIGRQQDVKSGLYLLLLQKREENSIALAATADNGKLIDEPLYGGKVTPKTMIIYLGALIAAFAIPFLLIFVFSLFRYKIEGHDDLARLTSLPIIADVAVASDQVKTSADIVVHENKNTQMDEIFRSLRTNITFMLKQNEKTILFTSSTSGEGKTFCAANLATSFALLGKKVVLCGLDIRKPALGRLFGVSDRSLGITSLLTKDQVSMKELEAQIVKSGANDNLDLLLAGPVPPNPTELLARDTFKQVVELLQQHYDYVIFDTAPVGLVTDTLQIAAHANVSVLVCRADYTPKSAFGLLNSLSKEGKLPNACVVLNGIDMSRRKYGYYYGYGAYGKYGRYGYGRYGNYGNYGNYGQYGRYAESHYGQKDDNSIKK